MASFGENLQREREMRGVSLQEISAATKIGVRFLQALETEDFGQLPGGIFTRSFIRAYARYLGLDEERVLADFQLVAQPNPDFDLNRLTANRPTPPQQGSRGPLLAIFLAVLLLVGGYGVYRYSHRAVETPTRAAPAGTAQSPAATSPAATPPAPAPASGTDSAPSTADQGAAPVQDLGRAGTATGVTAASGAGQENPPEALPDFQGGLVLQVAATEPSWVAVEADGKAAFQRVLGPSEIQTIKARESFDVTTGNALGVILTLNGETLKPLGRRGEVKSIHLTRSDVKKPSP
ncbi:MAG: helix-turn-helix domain-containing protein [Terriglobia bacterium]